MATYVLIHGAGDSAFYWHLLAPELRERGHEVVATDLPCDDDTATLSDYADTVVDAIGDRTGLVVVAQSFGGFTAPLVCERVPVDLMVLVAGMVPSPGKRGDDWFANTGYASAASDQDFDPNSEMEVFSRILVEEPPELPITRPDAPPGLVHLIRRMLAKDPDARPSDGMAIAAELQDLSTETFTTGGSTGAPEASEQRLLSVVLVGGGTPRAAMRATAQRYGATVEEVAGGAVAVTLSGSRSALPWL